MKQIHFDEGIREYAVNGDESRVIRVHISDLNLGKRVNDLEAEIARIGEKYRSIGEPTAEELYQLDCDVRDIINTAFGCDVCTAAFGTVNCCSPVQDGKIMAEGFVQALCAQIRSDIAETQRNHPPRQEVQAYLSDQEDVQEAAAESLPIIIREMTPEQRSELLRALSKA